MNCQIVVGTPYTVLCLSKYRLWNRNSSISKKYNYGNGDVENILDRVQSRVDIKRASNRFTRSKERVQKVLQYNLVIVKPFLLKQVKVKNSLQILFENLIKNKFTVLYQN